MKYKGRRYKLATADSEDISVCSVCVFADINCIDARTNSLEQDKKNCEELGDYFIEDTDPVKKHKRKKLKFNNK